MTFANIPQGSQVFLDANTIVYRARADPNHGAACKQLLERFESPTLNGPGRAATKTDR